MMTGLQALAEKLQERLHMPLPGKQAHEPLRAVSAAGPFPDFKHKSPPKPGSVLILLFEDQGEILFPLTRRNEYAGAHSGQVSFPGGKAEPGETPQETALREAEEEIGVAASSIQVVGTLSEFFVIPSNFMVTPVIGIMAAPPSFTPDPKEVSKILLPSLNQILPETAITTKEILAAGRYPMIAPHFDIEGHVVWGATAMMLNEFRMVVREVQGL